MSPQHPKPRASKSAPAQKTKTPATQNSAAKKAVVNNKATKTTAKSARPGGPAVQGSVMHPVSSSVMGPTVTAPNGPTGSPRKPVAKPSSGRPMTAKNVTSKKSAARTVSSASGAKSTAATVLPAAPVAEAPVEADVLSPSVAPDTATETEVDPWFDVPSPVAHTAEQAARASERSAERRRSLQRLIPAFVLVPVVSAAAVLLALNGASVAPAPDAAPVAVAGPAAPSVDSPAAEQWIIQNATRDQRIIVDDSMRADLISAGWNQSNVIAYEQVGLESVVRNTWRDADYIISTDFARASATSSQPLAQAIDNSLPVAAFGSDAGLVEVRRITPEGRVLASATQEQDAATRVELGSELASNTGVQMSVADRELVAAGRVDGRIISVLGALAGRGNVYVVSFPRLAGEQGKVIRQVTISAVDSTALVVDGQLTADARDLFDGLQGRYAPSLTRADGSNVLLRYPVSIDPLED